MTDAGSLQVGLAILGGLVLAGVVAHGAWTARKHQPRQPSADPLANLPETQTNQAMLLDPDATGTAGLDDFGYPNGRREPSFGAEPSPASNRFASSGNLEKMPRLDALLDAIATISFARPVSGEAALAAMPATRRTGSKQFAFEALSTQSGEWELPALQAFYSSIQCGVQLVNRHGALNAIEFSEFVVKVQAVSDTLGGDAEFPDMQETIARAKELDTFASAHDAQLGFSIRALKAAWSPGYVQQCASRLGFVHSIIPGKLVLMSSQPVQGGENQAPPGLPMLALHFTAQAELPDASVQPGLRLVHLVLEVPQVPQSLAPFSRLCEVALALAAAMDGEIVDDRAQRIAPEAMDAINTDIVQLYDALQAHGVAAGSPLARRLFS